MKEKLIAEFHHCRIMMCNDFYNGDERTWYYVQFKNGKQNKFYTLKEAVHCAWVFHETN